MKNQNPGPGAYESIGKFQQSNSTRLKGAVFDIAIKETAHSPGFKSSYKTGTENRHTKNLLGKRYSTPGIGSYEIFESGIGTGFGPPISLNLPKLEDSDKISAANSKDRRSKRREILLKNSKLSKIRGVSIPLA